MYVPAIIFIIGIIIILIAFAIESYDLGCVGLFIVFCGVASSFMVAVSSRDEGIQPITIVKTDSATIIEAIVDGTLERRVLTDVYSHSHAGQPGARIVWRRRLNSWGSELDGSFVVVRP